VPVFGGVPQSVCFRRQVSVWRDPGSAFRCGRPVACPGPIRAPIVFSQQEIERFFENVPSIRNRAGLIVAYGAGLRVSEVLALKVSDTDSQRMLLRVEQGKGHRDRYAMLSPRLLQVLRHTRR